MTGQTLLLRPFALTWPWCGCNRATTTTLCGRLSPEEAVSPEAKNAMQSKLVHTPWPAPPQPECNDHACGVIRLATAIYRRSAAALEYDGGGLSDWSETTFRRAPVPPHPRFICCPPSIRLSGIDGRLAWPKWLHWRDIADAQTLDSARYQPRAAGTPSQACERMS